MNQNSIQEEIKSRLQSENACSHLVQNLCLPVLSKNIKIKIHNYNFACGACMGVKLGYSH